MTQKDLPPSQRLRLSDAARRQLRKQQTQANNEYNIAGTLKRNFKKPVINLRLPPEKR